MSNCGGDAKMLLFGTISNRVAFLALIVLLAGCGVTAYEIPGEAEDPRKFQQTVKSCQTQRQLNFNKCMADAGYVARDYRPGDRKTLWLPTNEARMTAPDAMRACGTQETLDQVSAAPDDPIAFFDCMEARGFEPKTVNGDAFTPIVFLSDTKSVAQHKVDYGLCGSDFQRGSVVPIDLYSNPNHPLIRCLLDKGYKGVPITDRMRVRWRSDSDGNDATENTILSCGGEIRLGEAIVPLNRLTSVALCLEEIGFDYEMVSVGGSGYRITPN